MNIDEITFFAIIYRISVIMIIVGADFYAEADIELKTAMAYLDGNYGGICAVSSYWYSYVNK